MNKWEEQLDNFDSLLCELREGQQHPSGRLRFDRSLVIASDVASQFYCEKKVEMQYLHGKVETEAKTVGTQAHLNLTQDSVKVKRAELWRKIYGAKPVFALEMFLLAKYGDVLLAGKPDSVFFKQGSPLVVFEYKFSRSSVAYPSYHVQAQTYGVLLANMGFDTSQLFYAIVVADPETKGSRQLRRDVVHTVVANPAKTALHSIEGAKIYVNKLDFVCAEMDLRWALEYWKQTREAKATTSQSKCDRCEYQTYCT